MPSTEDQPPPIGCDPAACRPTGCGWYHGTWPLLRELGLAATPERNGTFFASALGEAADLGLTRILVTGAADSAMPRLVSDACRARRVDPQITVLDRCPTPIARIRADLPAVRGWVADVLTVAGSARFDVLCSHGLLPSVPVVDRPALAARWAGLLVEGGRLITTTSLRPGSPGPRTFADPDAFADRARQRAVSLGLDRAGRSLDEIAAAARRWAVRVSSDPVRSVEEVVETLEPAGFTVVVHEREVAGTIDAPAAGPWSAGSARYAEIVATKVVR